MKTLLCGQFKGGIGKTYHNVILTQQLSERGYKVLFIDFDNQLNGTTFLTRKAKTCDDFKKKNIYNAFVNEDIKSNIQSHSQNIDFVAGSQWINQFETLMNQKNEKDRHLFVRKLLAQVVNEKSYDFAVFDISPSNSSLNLSVMAATTHHIVVSQSEYFAMQMVPEYIQHIKLLKHKYNVPTNILGVSVSLLDTRSSLEKKVVLTIMKNFEELVFNTVIRRKAALKNYSAEGYPDKKLKKDHVALAEYSSITDEILDRLNMKKTLVGDFNETK